ncbi:MAG: BMC domain-containing protein [bacterium]
MTLHKDVTVLGGLELDSVAAGVQALDAAVKAAPVAILDARTVCPGKYLLLITGSEAAVEAALAEGSDIRPDCVLDRIYLSNLHPGVPAALAGGAVGGDGAAAAGSRGGAGTGAGEADGVGDDMDALGVLESYTSFAVIEAADRIAKAAEVKLLHIRIGDEMGGKASVKFSGPISEVEAAIAAGVDVLQAKGVLCKQVVIPRPDAQIKPFLTRG